MTMRATRDALENPWQTVWVVDEAEPERGAQPSIVERDTSAALAEVAAVEAVVEAARDRAHALAQESAAAARGDYTEAGRWSTQADREDVRLDDALARLDAVTGGQTAGDGERVETASDNASLTPSEGDPVPAPAACPCDGTDCVC